ncbi:MAG: UDP-N-acetylglucosamine 1-carboxyvinyltransferase [bacterium]|nr:UDP-N-acetylglucosamine 1-carboxyvinyltransferase [bacterium]
MNTSIRINGGKELSGTVAIQGSKNAFHKILGACVRWPGVFRLRGVPDIQDAKWLLELFEFVGGTVVKEVGVTILDSRAITSKPITKSLAEKSTGTFLFAGALLARFGKVEIAPPGGDNIGNRPVNYHLDAFKALGAHVEDVSGLYRITGENLQGIAWTFPGGTVNGTINAILAVTGAQGKSTLRGCVVESDIENAIEFMNRGGANIKVTSVEEGVIEVTPIETFVTEMEFQIVPDRNATATYALAGVLLCKELALTNANVTYDNDPLWEFLKKVGASVEVNHNTQIVVVKKSSPQPLSETVEGTIPPGFSTDWGPLVQVLLTQLPGKTEYYDTVFTNRFALVPEIAKMGVRATLHEVEKDTWVNPSEFNQASKYDRVRFEGSTILRGAEVRANDIRNGAALVLAGLLAEGQTTISDAIHIKRGYEDMIKVFKTLGADINWLE